MHHRFRWLIFVAAVILALSSGEGCERRPKRIAPAQTLVVPVSRPVKRNVTEFADYRDVDGVKVPYQLSATSPIQSYTVKITSIEHNVKIDQALFAKPVAK